MGSKKKAWLEGLSGELEGVTQAMSVVPGLSMLSELVSASAALLSPSLTEPPIDTLECMCTLSSFSSSLWCVTYFVRWN